MTIKHNRYLILIPIIGTIIFIILYIVAAHLYPGGSQADVHSKGFSWKNNYWCNLLNEQAINGEQNTAKPIAVTAMFILCFTLASFWYLFPSYIFINNYGKLTIQLSGCISMFITLFLFTGFHDVVINIAGIFGIIALVGTYIGLYKLKMYKLFRYGIFNSLLVALNNYIYYHKGLIIYLPVVQKISFTAFLIWICCICIYLFRRDNLSLNST